MTLTQLNKPLADMGGFPVLWDTELGTLVQDPTQGGTNAYGPGDMFHDPANGDVFQLGSDGSLNLVHSGAPPAVPGATAVQGAAAPLPVTVNSTNVSSALPAWSTPNTTPAISVGGNATQFSHQIVSWLSKASFISGLPNGLLVAGGLIGYQFFKQHRRRNPGKVTRRRRGQAAHWWAEGTRSGGAQHQGTIQELKADPGGRGRGYYRARHERRRTTGSEYARDLERRGIFRGRNPKGPRAVYNRLLGAWYVVVGPHQTPISGRFSSRAAALAWLSRRG